MIDSIKSHPQSNKPLTKPANKPPADVNNTANKDSAIILNSLHRPEPEPNNNTALKPDTLKASVSFFDSSALKIKPNILADSSVTDSSLALLPPVDNEKPVRWQDDTAFIRLLHIVVLPGLPVAELKGGEPHRTIQKNYLFYALICTVLLLAIIKHFFPKYFSGMFSLMFQASFKQKQTRELLMHEKLPSLLLNILFIIVEGFFVALIAEFYNWINANLWQLVILSIIILTLLYFGKYLFIHLIGWIFNAKEQASAYNFIVSMINKVIGIGLIPFLLLLAFSAGETWHLVLNTAVCVIVLLLLFRYIVSFKIIRTNLSLHPLHFFIYLCGVELMPILIIYKLLVSYIGNGQ